MTFLRLSRWHAIAGVAALVLLVAMAMDWYTTAEGEDARRTESFTEPPASGLQGDIDREVIESSEILAEKNEDNAWEASEVADRIVLVLLLATIALALAAAALRAADRGTPGPFGASALAAGVAALTALAVAVRLIYVGGSEVGGEVELGAPLALVALGVLAFGAARAARAERAEHEGGRAHPAAG